MGLHRRLSPSVQPRSLNWMRRRRTHAPTALPDSGEFYLLVDFFYRQLNNNQLADYNFSCDQSWYIVMLGYRAEPLALLIVSNLYFSCSPLREKWFVATGQIFFKGGWCWSRPYSGMLGSPETSRPYKWNSRGGWWYEPPLQLGLICRGGSLTSRPRCLYL